MKRSHIPGLVSHLMLLLSVGTGVCFLLFGWINHIVDSNFYLALAQYFQTGVYPFWTPFIYSRPTTISPPGYALMLLALQWLPHPDIMLHVLQILLLAGSACLIFLMLHRSVGNQAAIISACIFFLLPANLLYSSYMLTENGASFLVTLFLFLVYRYETGKQSFWIGLACVLAAIMTLWKYSFVIYFAYAMMVFLKDTRKRTV